MKNTFIILVIIFALSLVALVFVGMQQEQVQEPSPTRTPSTPPPPGVPAPTTYNLSGTLLAVQGDLIRFGANVERTEDGGQLIEEKVARVSVATQIVRFETVTNPETGRPRVEERAITLADLQPGDRIQVISNRDILAQTEIEATKIRFLGRD